MSYTSDPNRYFPLLCEGNIWEIVHQPFGNQSVVVVPRSPEFEYEDEAQGWIEAQIQLFEKANL